MIFDIKNRVLKRRLQEGTHALIGDNSDYAFQFYFDSEWDNVIKTARFIRNDRSVDIILDAEDTVIVPKEALKEGWIQIGVYSTDKSTTYDKFYCVASIREKEYKRIPCSPDVYAQLTGRMDEINSELIAYVEQQSEEQSAEIKKEIATLSDELDEREAISIEEIKSYFNI